MEKVKIVEWVDINASCARVFDLVLDVQRRMQLSPLWGVTRVEEKSPDYPAEGSSYRVKFLKDEHPDYCTVVTELQQGRKFAYHLQIEQETSVCWSVQETPRGTRLVYEEEFLCSPEQAPDFGKTVREITRKWLTNLKRYAELKERGLDRLIRWFLDRHFLKLMPDQRNVILTVLFMHGVGALAFVMSAIALGVASLF